MDMRDDVLGYVDAYTGQISELARFASLESYPCIRIRRTIVGQIADELPRPVRPWLPFNSMKALDML
jgi:hypothetical protein